ncbi:glucokinase [uncultured Paraglaciecola sp.]|uniref:glucokinase n=1 Tax=uncultured Paraglaciecola sp. TaxID=1765024 RepID=UPI0030D71C5C|tara:strand:- start:6522 stop:7472 length:951 start_codon:yes stop_codon:yes gene_type:complete
MARFVADVGGTNIRLALIENGSLSQIKKYLCSDYKTINAAIEAYIAEFPELDFTAGCLGVACPVNGDVVSMTNNDWQFSISQLKTGLGLDWLGVINDFTAVAHAVTVLTNQQKEQVGQGQSVDLDNIAVFGPGTGLGVKHLTHTAEGWLALDGEGGHVDFAPVDEVDIAIWQFLTDKFGHASAEEVMSGRGLVHIYQAIAKHKKQLAPLDDPADITERALDGSCVLSAATLNQFCKILGSFAGNLALNLGTRGGVYIGGGIAPRFTNFIKQSDFRKRFEAKGRFRDYVAGIPTFIITEPDHGLIGAMAYLNQNCKG